MKTIRCLLLLCSLAFIAVPSAFGFHVPPWDTGHQSFDGDEGDPNTDCGSGDGCDQSPCPCKGGSPVDVSTGNFRYFTSSVFFQGAGPAVDLTLVYNSQSLHAGPFGQGWSHPYDARIIEISMQSTRSARAIARSLPATRMVLTLLRRTFERLWLRMQTAPSSTGIVMERLSASMPRAA
jgi:hypothetical protein